MKKITVLLLLMIPLLAFSQVDLPITFEDTASVNYIFADFGGTSSAIVADPTDSTNLVGQVTKNGPETWAGTVVSGGGGLANAIPFSTSNSRLSVRVWSPAAGTPILLKIENAADGGIFAEVVVNTTVAAEWETLTFDYNLTSNGVFDLANVYNNVVIFFDFGTVGMGEVYYFDDIEFVLEAAEKIQVDLPITFEDTATVDYNLADFGGTASMIVEDPTDAGNLVVQVTKDGPETWAGTVAGGTGLANAIPFSATDSKISVRVWSPTAGIPVLLKIENAADGGIFAELGVNTTVASEWETLEFDLTMTTNGVFDLANVYDKVVVFFDFGTVGTGEVYYFDDIQFVSSAVEKVQLDLPITFEDTTTVDYNLADFGGTASLIVEDPTDATNLVVQVTKDGPETWAGTVPGGNGLASPIPFSATDSKISVRVWSPKAGIPILLKIENSADGGIFAELAVNTTVASEWETLEFDFTMTSNGVFDLANVYDKVVIFFDFGTVGTGEVYYFDDIIFLSDSGVDALGFADKGLKVSPNPATDFIQIDIPNEVFTTQMTMGIFDVNGKLIRNEYLSSATSSVSVSELNSGIYFLRIQADGYNLVHRIMVAK